MTFFAECTIIRISNLSIKKKGVIYMGMFDSLISPTVYQEEVKEEKSDLNFQNEDSVEQREIADQDLMAAKILLDNAEKSDDERVKKACDKKATENAMEAVEKYQKSVIYADENHEKINNDTLHKKLEKTHNHSFQQRETEKAGISILESEDIKALSEGVRKKQGEKSPYNAIRFSRQNTAHQNAKKAVEVAEKAKNNLESMIEEQKKEKIQMGDLVISIEI